MATRRDFLKRGAGAVATGIVFCGCGLSHGARAQQSVGRKSPVMINGKRVKTIDMHAHCYFHETVALLGEEGTKIERSPVNGAAETFLGIDQRLAAMDAQAVDMEVLSINPFWYGRDRDLAAQIVKIHNEKLAELCASRPDRFAAFASLTLQAPDLAVRELETAIKKQGLKGAAIGCLVNDEDFFAPKFHPVWARNSACPSLSIRRSIHRAFPSSPNGWRAMAGSATPSAIRSTRRLRSPISSLKARSTAFPA